MLPFALPEKYKTIKLEPKKKAESPLFPKRGANVDELFIATVKIFHIDEDGDPTSTRIRITVPGKQSMLQMPLNNVKYKNLRIGTYKDKFYFKADELIFE